MSSSIYLFKLRPENVFNLPMALILESHHDKFLDACTCSIDDHGLIIITPGAFSKSYTDNVSNKFRQLNWVNSVTDLDQNLSQARSLDKNILFATYLTQQVALLKQHFNNDILTIGVDFNENNRQFLLKNLAKQHVKLLLTNQITANEHDKKVLVTNSLDQLLIHYTLALDHLIPQSEYTSCDYTIPLSDFFNLEKLNSHLTNLGFPLNDRASKFYNDWLGLNFHTFHSDT